MSTLRMFQLTVVIWGAAGVLVLVITHQSLLGRSGQTLHIYLENKRTQKQIIANSSDMHFSRHIHHTPLNAQHLN